MPTRRSLHDSDFYAWSFEQAALLRAGRVGEADLAAIAEEIESMGKTEKRELISRVTVLLLHLLKWRGQPAGRGNSWRLSIANARDEIADLLADNPSLKTVLDEVTASAYRYARRNAAIETEMGEEAFPAQCPWRFAQAMDEGFWPE
ncbi:MAG: DUF29 domain-containing protein [Roseiarcus sp.]